ncbi:hypothetical protein ADK67_31100 [Saccharothrix sp. NRRL B-16348]|nr:hypothetical protein ADK67_31100 [Saccharothrix sp. NRRL B-16348]
MKAAVVGLFAVAGALVPIAGANAAPAGSGVGAQQICGFYENAVEARYGHCGPTWVKIRVDRHNGLSGYDLCVPPWSDSYLGSDDVIANAFYTGLC